MIAPELPQAAVEMQLAGLGAFEHRGEIPSSASRELLLGLRRDDGEDHDGHLTADDAAGLAPKAFGHAPNWPSDREAVRYAHSATATPTQTLAQIPGLPYRFGCRLRATGCSNGCPR
jgi:hypothetical protein